MKSLVKKRTYYPVRRIRTFRNAALFHGLKALAKEEGSMVDFPRVGNTPMPNRVVTHRLSNNHVFNAQTPENSQQIWN